ncbi:hypothetical protein T484DRAFT_1764921 [Baffinella frigidus]|nr:hypothetical protein T484DRAFT_1764921 [Cryptophyta sp. CCMP2293]
MGLTFVHPDYASWAKTIASVGMLTFSLIGASLGVWKAKKNLERPLFVAVVGGCAYATVFLAQPRIAALAGFQDTAHCATAHYILAGSVMLSFHRLKAEP